MDKIDLSMDKLVIDASQEGGMLQPILANESNYTPEDRSTKHATLFDFTTVDNLNDWYEVSDSVREVGKSKGVMVLQKTRVFQRAIFFSLLNPQPNGACFAGVKTETMFDLSKFESLTLNVRGQGSASIYKVVIKHKSQNSTTPDYEQTFEAPMDEEFVTVRLDLDKFKPYFRGKFVNDTEPLDKSHITSIGLQVAGGVYLPNKQSGVSSLEIDWMRADI
ncbi:uncharacterized protein LOC123295167 isoform X4 [Chrysoperla carnea]|uniref:uncharacterized protein LOC123295167 isoform X4 n=1 Tax=Chrysoperla carnea TaxID=189513 RepID=UPI001D06C001|nr:uncharacterized protein LOC123295167 isoform X4 [Chrysoperla carnea]